MLNADLVKKLDLDAYTDDQYRQALTEVPQQSDESPLERRMREVTYLSLTRVLPIMLDRKDRISMAVGLEVRVPFCDHRLVEYVFNTPWSLKTYDGREKSILRGAVRDVLPAAVADRKKSGYPGSHDPNYLAAIQQNVRDLIAADHPVMEFHNCDELQAATDATAETIVPAQRFGIERFLDFATWIDLRAPELTVD
jgi:asparagine synthase (glutamine-hydrolysing)